MRGRRWYLMGKSVKLSQNWDIKLSLSDFDKLPEQRWIYVSHMSNSKIEKISGLVSLRSAKQITVTSRSKWFKPT